MSWDNTYFYVNTLKRMHDSTEDFTEPSYMNDFGTLYILLNQEQIDDLNTIIVE